MKMVKIRYRGKEPYEIVGGVRPVVLKKGDILETTERKAQAYCLRQNLFELVKEKAKKEGKE